MTIPLYILVGPTASGKSRLSILLAKHMDAEIISADSMAIYRGMDIGTAKPSIPEQKQVKHHLIDICDPWETYNAGRFVEKATDCIKQIQANNRKILIVGGTALYIKSLIEGIFEGPPADWKIRETLAKRDNESLYSELMSIDEESAQKISPNDLRRIIRALEVYYITKIPISVLRRKYTKPNSNYITYFIGISWERPLLYERINKRVDHMLKNGLLEETKKLLHLPYPLSHTASQAIGYRETILALKNEIPMAELEETIKRNTRRFAKRQMTWLRRFPVNWIPSDNNTQTEYLFEQALKYFS